MGARIRAIDMPDIKPGTKVEIRAGNDKGKVFTVHQSANDWVEVIEKPGDIFSKRSVKVMDDA